MNLLICYSYSEAFFACFFAAFFGDAFLADFLGADFFADFFGDDFLADFFGTFPPSFLASDKPIAIACLGLVTFLPLRPLLSLPSFISSMARFTLPWLFFPYFAIVVCFNG